MTNRKVSGFPTIGFFFLVVGLIFTALSFDYQNQTSAIIGLTLLLWGGILIYARPNKHIQVEILKKTTTDLYNILQETITDINKNIRPIYHFEGSLEQLNIVKMTIVNQNMEPLEMTPPGYGLHLFFETQLRKNFSTISFDALKRDLHDTIVNDLGLASDLTLTQNNEIISVDIQKNIFSQTSPNKSALFFGDPLSSSIGCILTRNMGEKIELSEIVLNGEHTTATYRVM